nr:nonstructural protein [Bovine coronavirus]WNV26576.1 nonstructural protein [Bovine coronavirus]
MKTKFFCDLLAPDDIAHPFIIRPI